MQALVEARVATLSSRAASGSDRTDAYLDLTRCAACMHAPQESKNE